MRPKIYVSGPMTKGNREHNFNQAADAQKQLMLAGFAVFNPILSMALPGCWDIPHAVWIENDLPFIADDTHVCVEAVLRLPGESPGADEECRYAERDWGIPVYDDIDELISNLGALTNA